MALAAGPAVGAWPDTAIDKAPRATNVPSATARVIVCSYFLFNSLYATWTLFLMPPRNVLTAYPLYFAGSLYSAAAASTVFPALISPCTHLTKSVLKAPYSLRSAIVILGLWPVMMVSTFLMLAAAALIVLPESTALPPLFASMIGVVLPANASPECITRSVRKTTQASPLVWARPK